MCGELFAALSVIGDRVLQAVAMGDLGAIMSAVQPFSPVRRQVLGRKAKRNAKERLRRVSRPHPHLTIR